MRPEREKLSRLPAVAMLVIASVMVSLIGYFSYENGRSRDRATRQLTISRQIQDTTNQLLSLVNDAERGQRGFLITGRESYLNPYNQAIAAVPAIFQKLDEETRTRPEQAERVRALRPVVDDKLRELAQTISLRRKQGLMPAKEIVETDMGRNVMQEIRAKSTVIRDDAERGVGEYTALAEASDRRLRAVSTIGSLLLLAFIILSAVTIFRSLAHRERLYREAAATAERFHVTLRSIGDAVIATGVDKKITFINAVAQELSGWTEAEALGQPISQVFRVVNETTRDPVENPLDQAIATGAIVGLDNHTLLITRNGSEISIDDSGSPIRDRDGSITGAILVFRDISARRRTERQLKESNEHLNEFVYAAAHDLRAPLGSVNNFAQLLSRRFGSQLGGDGKTYLDFITSGLQRMSRLLEDLLNYAQASHFDPGDGANASMDRALGAALENLRGDIEANHAVVTADDLPVVPVYDAHLVQLLQNLIGNALKYRSDAEPRVEVSCEQTESGWQIQVRDNGIGIEPSYKEEIFKPFKRLHGEERPGSGIGLATCQKIVSGYGGQDLGGIGSRNGLDVLFHDSFADSGCGCRRSAMIVARPERVNNPQQVDDLPHSGFLLPNLDNSDRL